MHPAVQPPGTTQAVDKTWRRELLRAINAALCPDNLSKHQLQIEAELPMIGAYYEQSVSIRSGLTQNTSGETKPGRYK